MLRIICRIASVDMNGFTGREHHPDPSHIGRMVRITNMDTVWVGPGVDTYQTFHGVVIDSHGHDTGEQLELMAHELDSFAGAAGAGHIPVLFNV